MCKEKDLEIARLKLTIKQMGDQFIDIVVVGFNGMARLLLEIMQALLFCLRHCCVSMTTVGLRKVTKQESDK